MIFDKQALFSDRQEITATTGSTNVVDLLPTGTPYGNKQPMNRDIGRGNKIPLLVQVVETFTGLTALTVTVQTSDDPDFGSGIVTHGSTGSIPVADLKAGWFWGYDVVPIATTPMKRYMRLNYGVTGTGTGGRIMGGITMGTQTNG